MSARDEFKSATVVEWLAAVALVAAGFMISAASMGEIRASAQRLHLAQATQPPSSSTEGQKKDEPAESKPGGARPTTPAPEPARPDEAAQKAGAQPALPPAPAEKTAAPIKDK